MSPNDSEMHGRADPADERVAAFANAIKTASVQRERASLLIERSRAVVAAARDAVGRAKRARAGGPDTSATLTQQRVSELEDRLHRLTNAVTGALLEAQYQRTRVDAVLDAEPRPSRRRGGNRGVILQFPQRPAR